MVLPEEVVAVAEGPEGAEVVGGPQGLGRGEVLVVPWGTEGPGLGVAGEKEKRRESIKGKRSGMYSYQGRGRWTTIAHACRGERS